MEDVYAALACLRSAKLNLRRLRESRPFWLHGARLKLLPHLPLCFVPSSALPGHRFSLGWLCQWSMRVAA